MRFLTIFYQIRSLNYGDVCDYGLKKAIEYSEDVYLKTLMER